ncbi:unannotated protein [freshwater metagenome]|uniref:Unannotated protein n=1 Tax=freshwater metagenome TaxID=449393 RepID=A0A6J6V683_9ZZZZ|nr:AMP-binding protein [Actinomycetota bacterium]
MTLLPVRVSQGAGASQRGVALARDLGRHGERPALIGEAGATSYAELAGLVDAAADRHAARAAEPLLLAVRPRLEDVVTYLACLAVGRPVLLTDPARSTDELEARFGPRPGAPAPHPDLALLMSTSGSTGSPRLVRLSARAVQANAEAIADYLGLTPDDVGVTALPLHYCYGLSVLHSHLAVGAAVVLTETSVVDPCFWAAVDRHGVTSVAGVPHSFEMLEVSGAADRLGAGQHPSVRVLTQAGGRMAPSTVRSWAERGERGGFDLVVMYGQTEATARMAYLPPHLAAERPDCVGVPVPGGDLRLEPVAGQPEGVGELVYSGPNVMMGYAETREDLARGHDLTELRTGDLGRQDADGLWRVVGRRSRFAKVLGLRVDLDRVESGLAAEGVDALVVDAGDRVAVGVVHARVSDGARVSADGGGLADPVGRGTATPADREGLADLVARTARLAGIPAAAVTVVPLQERPLLASGKPDRQRVAALARRPERCATAGASCAARASSPCAADVLSAVLGRPVTPRDSFASLGGDSLSYVEASVRLEQLLGGLPDDWHLRPVGTLVAAPTRRAPRGWQAVETGVLLRALAIVAIVGTHGNLLDLTGGAHLLLVLMGFNLGRFALGSPQRRERVKALVRSAARVAVPSVLWIGGVTLLTGQYPWATALLVNQLVGPRSWAEPAWHFWFIEAFVLCVLGLALLAAVPAVHRLDRRHPFWFPLVLSLVGLLTRYEVVVLRGGDVIHRAEVVLWLVALGWAAARATTTTHRAVVSALLVLTVPGFFTDPVRDLVVLAAALALVWVRRTWVPVALVPLVSALAAASLWIYLTHWQVYPHLEVDHPLLATLASLLVGILVHRLVSHLSALTRRVFGADPSHLRG